jgi:hypothetical protein
MSAAASPSPASREKTASQKMLHRLNTVFESGKVMPVAFLPAARSAPLALLDHAPSCAMASALGGAPSANNGPAALASSGHAAAAAGGAVGGERDQGGSALSQSAMRLVSDLAVDSLLAGVPQQMRDNYMKQVCVLAIYSAFSVIW